MLKISKFSLLHIQHRHIMRYHFKTCFILASMLLFLVYYYRRSATNSNIYNSHSVIPNITDSQDLLVNTIGCIIPNYAKNWSYTTPQILNRTCDHRAIFIKPIDNDKILFYINDKKIKQHLKRNMNYQCCYQFGIQQTVLGKKQVYDDCIPLKTGMAVKQIGEIIRVSCEANPGKKNAEFIYDDVFIKIKPKAIAAKKSTSQSWNVILLGIGTMSRARVYKAMPQTVNYLQNNKWLDYKGYHKVGHNTLQNLISLLTGRDMSTFNEACGMNSKMCDNVSVWQQYRNADYITAFGDDHFQLSNVFSKHKLYNLPSDHYLQSFVSNEGILSQSDSCMKTYSTQLLDYARQFTTVYKNRKFFGMLWLSSFDNDLEINPSTIDKDLVEFLKYTTKIGILKNTFIILLSDQGIKNGRLRIPVEAYYEERLPMFFMWIPDKFKKLFIQESNNALFNQDLLITPYDVYVTLINILSLSGYLTEVSNADSCSRCAGLFTKYTSYRKCNDIGIEEQLCSCHNMINIDDDDARAELSLKLAVSYVRNKAKTIKTIPCSMCHELELESVIRKHFYWYNNKLYYVIVFKMVPGHLIYEATILDDDNKLSILSPILALSHHGKGNCAIDPNHQMYCLCNLTNCNKDIIISKY